MLKTKILSNEWTILRIERQFDFLEVLYILKNEDNTFPGMNNKFPEELGPILRYNHAQNQVYVKKNENSKD